ncbi:MAG: formylglycine-generating enzyme family protein [Deltaproteobacteria bacterium]|nr:formylglycine-generating enzyme family protein [Deltaproteobacteria bacterium]
MVKRQGNAAAVVETVDNPEDFPPAFAAAWGEDRYGLFCEFTYKRVVQRMRWISPGTFRMGSPTKGEQQRGSDEIEHSVTLTKGFWLADTACTQALWQAVMGNNPSFFKGPDRPVENVSWKDCQRFLEGINGLIPELALRLPTEAEWEYACRAGTTTPFSFGKNITSDEVNYDGNYPYAGGKKGIYRQETVGVKALACNEWGLYQMHGNVWEWCRDWYGEYPSESAIDPIGPEKGARRVLRGGGWYNDARHARSACRVRHGPGNRGGGIGFRFARGQ